MCVCKSCRQDGKGGYGRTHWHWHCWCMVGSRASLGGGPEGLQARGGYSASAATLGAATCGGEATAVGAAAWPASPSLPEACTCLYPVRFVQRLHGHTFLHEHIPRFEGLSSHPGPNHTAAI